jgi:hypothetical protein
MVNVCVVWCVGRWSDADAGEEDKERRADEAGWGFEGGEAGIMIMMRRND